MIGRSSYQANVSKSPDSALWYATEAVSLAVAGVHSVSHFVLLHRIHIPAECDSVGEGRTLCRLDASVI